MSQQINLFNPIFLKQKKYFSVVTMLQALGLIVLGSMLFYGYAWYQVQQLAQQTQEMTRRYEAEQKRLVNYANEFSPQRAQQALNAELNSLEAQNEAQEAILQTLKSGAIGNTRGYSEYLSAFARQAIKGLWLTGFDINGDGAQIGLHGAVTDPKLLPGYIQRLGREEVMRGKTFESMQMKQPVIDGKAVNSYLEFGLLSGTAERAAQ